MPLIRNISCILAIFLMLIFNISASSPVAVVVTADGAIMELGDNGNGNINGGAVNCKLTVESAGSYYLLMKADLPWQVGLSAIKYTVSVDGKKLRAAPPSSETDGGWNNGYMPYFLVEGDELMKSLTFLLPLTFSVGEHTLDIITPENSKITELKFVPAIPDDESKLKFIDKSRIYFPGEISHARLIGVKYAGEVVFQLLRLADAGESDEWGPDIRVVPIKNIGRAPVNKYNSDIAFPTTLHGLIGATLISRNDGRMTARYLGSVAVVPKRDTARYAPDGIFLATANTRISADRMRDYKRAGIDWVRVELGCGNFAPEKGKYKWDDMD